MKEQKEQKEPKVIIDGREVGINECKYDPVTYVPGHAKGNASHPDCEQGVIISICEGHVKVLYCKTRTIQSTNPEDLVWG